MTRCVSASVIGARSGPGSRVTALLPDEVSLETAVSMASNDELVRGTNHLLSTRTFTLRLGAAYKISAPFDVFSCVQYFQPISGG